jgi:hypothetical protein
MDEITFTDTTISVKEDDGSFEMNDVPYEITEFGHIKFFDPEDQEDIYVVVKEKTDEYIKIFTDDEEEEITFFEYEKAKEYLDLQNEEILANSEESSVSGTVVFKDYNGSTLPIPDDARIRITSQYDQSKGRWESGFNTHINSDGSFAQTKTIYENSYKDGNKFQVTIFKNHIEPDESYWDCNEDVYKFVGGDIEFGNWSYIEVYPYDYYDNSNNYCE